jgi:predicted methyltransferase
MSHRESKIIVTVVLAPWQEEMWESSSDWVLGRKASLISDYHEIAHEIVVHDILGKELARFPTGKFRA